ncbi:hypothetical protein [Paucibacter sp. DJ2R-2]|uniref:hypothetical protein n=1 Tax=Paucibacter sp. DJ2R-2 TaxID=2893558 RepID=UPI0021E4164A|nr:hypothetical protein [Paucibacter sp. DJ2R-2]MCV2422328.1 hypothetical protein [Paucibacter sp. DJ4R-1]MCV2440520.1 hypothetical protein [Paucibacter sp. DJ2R-2]
MSAPAAFLAPRRNKLGGWAIVMLVHIVLLAMFFHARQSNLVGVPKPPAQGQWVSMRLLSRPSLLPMPPKPKREMLRRASPPGTARARAEQSLAAPPHSPVPATAEPGPNAITWVAPPAAPAPPQAKALASPAPLQLGLPGRAASGALPGLAEMVRRDPRANTQRLTVEARIASALGNAEISEESIKPGHTRFRQGSSCIDVQDARVSELFAFDAVARGAPKLVSACKK